MTRRRRVVPPSSTESETPLDPPVEGRQPQIDVRMRGSADDVKRQLGVPTEAKPEKKPDANGHDDEKKKFVESLRNSKYVIRVKRLTPREFNGHKTNVEVWHAELPLAYNEIQEEIRKECLGGKYRVAVIDPSSNQTVCADVFEVDGDPAVPESDMSQEEIDRVLMQGKPKTAADMTEEALERRARVSSKMLEVEALEAQLEEARQRRAKPEKLAVQDNTRVDELERRLAEAKHQAELESRDRKHAEEIRDLKALITARPKEEPTNQLTVLLEQMREDRKASDQRFTALMTQMKDDKLNAVLDEVKSIKNKPQQNNMLEMAETMLKLNKMISGVRGDDDDEDDDDDKDDDRPWWERAIDKLGGKFGDKFLEKLFEKFTDMEGKGQQVTREQFIKDMQDEAQRLADDAVAKAKRPALPPPPPALALPPPPPPLKQPVAGVAPEPVTTLPPPPLAVAAPPPQAHVVPVSTEVPQKLTIEQEIVLRVGGVLEMIEREMELRPNEYMWNYEGAYNALPESILEKVCDAQDPVAMFDAFAIPLISQEKLAEIKAKVSGNPRIMAWLKVGHDELKLWWAEKQKDPQYDPFADEEGEEE